jgi:hypothetical protein
MSDSPISDEVVTLVHAIRDDEGLREWLFRLEECPDSVRRTAFAEMIEKMKSAGEDATLIAAISELARPEIYAAACKALRELRPG